MTGISSIFFMSTLAYPKKQEHLLSRHRTSITGIASLWKLNGGSLVREWHRQCCPSTVAPIELFDGVSTPCHSLQLYFLLHWKCNVHDKTRNTFNNKKFPQLGWLWTTGRLYTIFNISVLSQYNEFLDEILLVVKFRYKSLWWVPLCEILCTETIQRCWRITQSHPAFQSRPSWRYLI